MPVDMKMLIAQAYMEKVKHEDVDKITVKSLIEACHISRQTFYYHFQDIMDVLEWSVRQQTQQLVEKSRQAENLRAVLEIFISFTVEQFPLLQKLMGSQRRAQMEQLLVDSIGSYLTQLADHQGPEVAMNAVDREILLQYSVCGLVGVLLAFGGRKNLDQERLAGQLEVILSGLLSGCTIS